MEGAVARSPVFVVVVAAAGVRNRWTPGKPCGIYRVALIYALLFSWLGEKSSLKLQNILETGSYRPAVFEQTVKPMAWALQGHMVAE